MHVSELLINKLGWIGERSRPTHPHAWNTGAAPAAGRAFNTASAI
jgi:hypothetical protein